ncbi:ATP-binding protein [Streptomyces sp. A7024]|uniref:ATP-binding protein n=1 Tax=Streptomyces coryli TaxID=1128680 RepID=A0A6G4UBF3_9ACTN|nr:AAA family ATPase [Streptomyces coryli]NGN69016.1 ATP-binding protein [Streptomyces coryli]
MIVWINGTFGAGKTTTARELEQLLPDARIFDPEMVGTMLRYGVTQLPEHTDFQQLEPWRPLVVATADQLLRSWGGTLIAVQTVLHEPYWEEIRGGLEQRGIPVRHFVLDADRATLETRIMGDTPDIQRWRLDHLDAYEAARPWLRRAGTVIDTGALTPAQAAGRIQQLAAGRSAAGSR